MSEAGAPLLVPYRAVGLVADPVPFSINQLGVETFITTAVGRSFQVFSEAKLRLAFNGPQLPRAVTALATTDELTAVACGTTAFVYKRAELLLVVIVLGGPYEATTFYQSVVVNGWGHLAPLLAIRYVMLTPLLLLLIAYLRSSTPRARADNKLTATLLIGLPSLAMLGVAAAWHDQTIVCPRADHVCCSAVGRSWAKST